MTNSSLRWARGSLGRLALQRKLLIVAMPTDEQVDTAPTAKGSKVHKAHAPKPLVHTWPCDRRSHLLGMQFACGARMMNHRMLKLQLLSPKARADMTQVIPNSEL